MMKFNFRRRRMGPKHGAARGVAVFGVPENKNDELATFTPPCAQLRRWSVEHGLLLDDEPDSLSSRPTFGFMELGPLAPREGQPSRRGGTVPRRRHRQPRRRKPVEKVAERSPRRATTHRHRTRRDRVGERAFDSRGCESRRHFSHVAVAVALSLKRSRRTSTTRVRTRRPTR